MTENEAIKLGKSLYENITINANNIIPTKKYIEFVRMANEALEEIQQYREIGSVKEIKIREAQATRLAEGYLNDLTLLREYQSIGTVEEFQALKEMTVTQMDIDTFRAYIDDCMDGVAFGNTDWNHSLALTLKCMELHKT